jgi:hypothetical protein
MCVHYQEATLPDMRRGARVFCCCVSRRFIYLHRDPYEIFQSATHMADAYYWYSYLQRPTDEQITEWILWQYEHLYDRYMAARALIRPSHHMEIAFAELDASPLQVLRRVYEHFQYAPRRVPPSSVPRACGRAVVRSVELPVQRLFSHCAR